MSTSEDRALRSNLIRLASKYPKGSDERRKVLEILAADFNPQDIGEVTPGPIVNEPDEPFMNGEFTQQEFAELGVKQESGELGDADPDGPAKLPAGPQDKAASEQVLFEGLVRLAHSDPKARGPILQMLREGGYIDENGKRTAGCEKLPEGPMRDNCEKKKEKGKAAKDEEGDKASRFTEGPEGKKEFDAWIKKQPEKMQKEWAQNTKKYRDRFKSAMSEEDRRVREGLIRLAKAKPEFRAKILPIVTAYDEEIREAAEEGEKVGAKWIQKAIKRPGRVHELTNTPKGEDVPVSKIKDAIKKLKGKKEHTPTETADLRALNMALTLQKV